MNSKYIYAIREKETGMLMNAKCGSGGKFYQINGHAQRRCFEYNQRKLNAYEVVTYELVEVVNEPERESFESKLNKQMEQHKRIMGY